MVCGEKLNYGSRPEPLECHFCKEVKAGYISCINGHFVCDACHGKDAYSAIAGIALSTDSKDPRVIAENIMSHPSVPMIGGEHHAIVATSVMAALKNNGPVFYGNAQVIVDNNMIKAALNRTWTDKVPSCTCANYGVCGAAMAAGAVFSLLTDTTCDTPRAKERQLAMEVTNYAALKIARFRGTCCKLSVRLGIDGACLAINDYLGVYLPRQESKCVHVKRNPYRCFGMACPYFKP